MVNSKRRHGITSPTYCTHCKVRSLTRKQAKNVTGTIYPCPHGNSLHYRNEPTDRTSTDPRRFTGSVQEMQELARRMRKES